MHPSLYGLSRDMAGYRSKLRRGRGGDRPKYTYAFDDPDVSDEDVEHEPVKPPRPCCAAVFTWRTRSCAVVLT